MKKCIAMFLAVALFAATSTAALAGGRYEVPKTYPTERHYDVPNHHPVGGRYDTPRYYRKSGRGGGGGLGDALGALLGVVIVGTAAQAIGNLVAEDRAESAAEGAMRQCDVFRSRGFECEPREVCRRVGWGKESCAIVMVPVVP